MTTQNVMENSVCRVAMWSGPRNISTALMRAFENRPDCTVVDEPFYAYYLNKTGLDHPGREKVLARQPNDANAVIRDLMAPLKPNIEVQYQKHMSHHIIADTPLDWMEGLHHCFLLREPAAMVASYVKSRADVCLEDMGVLQLEKLHDHIADRTGIMPLVIDSDDVLNNPAGMLSAICDRLSIPFTDAMLSWPVGPRDTDGAWAPWWYKNVEKSTKFETRKPFAGALSDSLQRIADAAQPSYERLSKHKLVLS